MGQPKPIFHSCHEPFEVLRCVQRVLVEIEQNARIKDEVARIREGLELFSLW